MILTHKFKILIDKYIWNWTFISEIIFMRTVQSTQGAGNYGKLFKNFKSRVCVWASETNVYRVLKMLVFLWKLQQKCIGLNSNLLYNSIHKYAKISQHPTDCTSLSTRNLAVFMDSKTALAIRLVAKCVAHLKKIESQRIKICDSAG